METLKTLTRNCNSEPKSNNTGGIIIPDFKLCHRAIVTKQHGTGQKQTRTSMG
jgi:hypothetical protein